MRWVVLLMLAWLPFVPMQAEAAEPSCASSVAAAANAFNGSAVCGHHESEPGTSAVSAIAQITYSYEPMCIRGEGIRGDGFYGCGEQMECGRNGHFYYVLAHHPDGTIQPAGEVCLQPSEEPTQAALTDDVVLRAFRRIPLPTSQLVVQPPGGETLVNLDTVFSTRAERFTRTIGLLGRRVELDIRPAEFRWVTGDGSGMVTDWAGRPWREGSRIADLITYRYRDASRLVTRVDTTWTARYRVNGGPWRDVGGTVTITGESFDLTVRSAGPYLTG